MKIVRVIARLNVGGPAKHVVWLTQGLQTPEWKSVLVAGTVPPGEDDMGYFATTMGVSPIFVPEMSREISAQDLVTVWKLYKLYLRERPDIVHTHTAKAGTVGRVAGLLYRWLTPEIFLGRPRKCAFVHTYHGHIFHSYYGPLKTRLFLAIEKALSALITDRIIVVSEQQKAEINRRFRVGRSDQFCVIPLGLDLDIFSSWRDRGRELRRELGLGSTDILIGIVGRLTEIKNHQLFLQAAALLKEQFDVAQQQVRFVIIGDGSLRTELEKKVASLGLAGDVVFLGSRRDMENIYPALDVTALSSLNEGTPLTLIEAMANGRAVVSTAVGGVVDLLGPTLSSDPRYSICERGISVGPSSPPALAAAMLRLAQDLTLRREIGERGLQFVTERYSKDRLLEDVRNLYADLLQKRAAAPARAGEQRFESRF